MAKILTSISKKIILEFDSPAHFPQPTRELMGSLLDITDDPSKPTTQEILAEEEVSLTDNVQSPIESANTQESHDEISLNVTMPQPMELLGEGKTKFSYLLIQA